MSCSAVIDTACSKTVAGIDWITNYTKNLDDYSLNQVLYKKPNTPFKFGDGRKAYSQNKATIPTKIGKTPCNIENEIVDAKIPLLLSKSLLKKANTLIDLKNDKVTMFDEDIDIKLSRNGHYAIDILPTDIYSFNDVNEVLIFQNCTSKFGKIKVLTKNPKQFGHTPTENMKGLLNNAGLLNSETSKLIEKVYNSCKTCLIYEKPSHRPVVGLKSIQLQ